VNKKTTFVLPPLSEREPEGFFLSSHIENESKRLEKDCKKYGSQDRVNKIG